MKNMKKRILSIALAIVILCCPLLNVSGSAHAASLGDFEAAALKVLDEFKAAYGETLGPIVLALGQFALGAVGVTFATYGQQAIATSEFVNSNPVIGEYLSAVGAVTSIGTDGFYHWYPTKVELGLFKKVVMKAMEYFGESTINVADRDKFLIDDVPIYSSIAGLEASQLFALATITIGTVTTFTVNGVDYNYSVQENGPYRYMQLNNINVMESDYRPYGEQLNVNNWSNPEVKYGFYQYIDGNGYKWIVPFFAACGVNALGLYEYRMPGNLLPEYYGMFPLSGSVATPIFDSMQVGKAITVDVGDMSYAFDTVIGNMSDTATLDIPLEEQMEDVENADDEEKVDGIPISKWVAILSSLGLIELLRTLKQTTTETTTESDFDTPEMPTNLKDKFPFCVPFDLIALVTALNAPAEVPSATIPLKFASLGYESSMTINLSQFEGVARAVRWGTTILFIFGLIVLTRKLIKG